MAKDVRVWDGSAWVSLRGPEGPSAVSADAGNSIRLGTDGKVFSASLPVSNPAYVGVISGPGGTAAAPSYTFTGDTDTGLCRTSANVMQIVAGGKPQMQVSDVGYMTLWPSVLEVISDVEYAPSMQIRNKHPGLRGAYFNLEKAPTSNTLAANSELGTIQFQGVDTGGTKRMGALIQSIVEIQTATFCAADIVIYTTSSTGAAAERFRVEADGGTIVRHNLTVQGTTNTFPQASVNSTAIGPMALNSQSATPGNSYRFLLTDAGKVVINANAGASTAFHIASDSNVNFPIGTVIELIDNSPHDTFINADAGVTLQWNMTIAPGVGGGVAARAKIAGRLLSTRLMKVAANSWWAFGSVGGA